MVRKVLDSWALMAWIMEEPSASKVEALLNRAVAGRLDLAMNIVNIGEVHYSLAKRGRREAAEILLSRLPSMPIRIVIPSGSLILHAARLKSWFPISYADAFAVATAGQQKAALVTGDRELRIFRGPFSKQELRTAGQADQSWVTDTVTPAGIVTIDWIGE